MIDAVSLTGGHLGAGLGVVELTVALHHVFDTPDDRLIWDVGHQAYPHKILTGRRDRIRTLRPEAAFPASPGAPKANTTRSAPRIPRPRSRPASAWRWRATSAAASNNVIAVIGDGAMSAGMAYEAMNNAGALDARLIVILNDNDMSIAPPTGAMSAYLARLASGRTYLGLRDFGKKLTSYLGKRIDRAITRAVEHARGYVTGGTLFEELGFYHIGPIDGHNLDHLMPVLRNVRDNGDGPVLIHVVTQKGKGYAPAEAAADKYHGVNKFDVITGAQAKAPANAPSLHQGLRREPDPGGARGRPDRRHHRRHALRHRARPVRRGVSVAHLRCRHRRAACGDLRRGPRHARASSPSPRSIRPSCSAPMTRSCTTWRSRSCRCAFRSTAPASSAPTAPTHCGAFDTTFLATLPGFVVMAAADEAELQPHGAHRRRL